MTAPLPAAIANVLPSDNELVMGTVVSGNPLTVNVRGANQRPGRLSTTAPSVGDTVALLREGATWLTLGKMIAGTATGLSLSSLQMSASNANLGLTAVEQDVPNTSLTFTTTSPNAIVFGLWFADNQALGANTATGTTMLRIDGVTLAAPAAIWRADVVNYRGTVGNADLRTVTPGSHTAILRANRAGGADGTLQLVAQHTTLILAVFE
jgi:hypothetical protein